MVSYNIQPNGGAVGGPVLPTNYITVSGGDPALTLPEAVLWDTGVTQAALPYDGDRLYSFEFVGGDTEWPTIDIDGKTTVKQFYANDLTHIANGISVGSFAGGSSGISNFSSTGLVSVGLGPGNTSFSAFGCSSIESADLGSAILSNGIYLENAGNASSTLKIIATTVGMSSAESVRARSSYSLKSRGLILDIGTIDGSIRVKASPNLTSITGTSTSIGKSQTTHPAFDVGDPIVGFIDNISFPNATSVGSDGAFNYSLYLYRLPISTVDLGSAALDGAIYIEEAGEPSSTLTITANRIGSATGGAFIGQSLIARSSNAFEGGGIDCKAVTLDGSVSMPNASSCSYASFENLTSMVGEFNLAGASLTQASVDRILNQLATNNGGPIVNTGTRTLDLSGGTNASPTGGASNADKLALEADGWTVTIN